MKETNNFKLKKPDGTDPININDFNQNFDIIDEILKSNKIELPNNIPISNGKLQSNLNSDMLNGKHASDFVKTYRLNAAAFQNTKLESGTYTNSGDGILNADGSVFKNDWWHIQVSYHFDNNGFGMQIITPLNNNNESRYYRTSNGTSWNNWIKILDQRDYDRLFQFASNGKNAIVNAITGKGINANYNMDFQTLANIISSSFSFSFSSGSSYHMVQGRTKPVSSTHVKIEGVPFDPIKGVCIITGPYSSSYDFYGMLIYEKDHYCHEIAFSNVDRNKSKNTICFYGSEKEQYKDKDGISFSSKDESYYDTNNKIFNFICYSQQYENISDFECSYFLFG